MMTLAERRQLALPAPEVLTRIAADAYSQAALQGASVQRALDFIEPLRAKLLQASDAYLFARDFDTAVGACTNDALQPVMTRGRDRYLDAVGDRLAALFRDAFEADPERAEGVWIRTVGEAFGEFQLPVLKRFAAGDGSPEGLAEWQTVLPEVVTYAARREWDLVQPFLDMLLDHPALQGTERALVLALASEVDLYVLAETESAGERAKEAFDLAPELPQTGVALAQWHEQSGRLKPASQLAKRFLDRNPTTGALHVLYGRCARATGDLRQAEERMLEGARQAPHSASVYLGLLTLYSSSRLFPSRESRLHFLAAQAAAIDPSSANRCLIKLGYAYARNGFVERAAEIIERAIAIDPTQIDGYIALADVHLNNSESQDAGAALARIALDRALEAQLVSADLATRYAEVCRASGDVGGTLGWRRKAISMAPGNTAVYHALLAGSLTWSGDRAGALKEAKISIQSSPGDNEALKMIAVEAWTAGDLDLVREMYEPFRDARGEVHYRGLLGLIAYDAGDWTSAREELSRAVILDPLTAEWPRRLSRALGKLGHWAEAHANLKAALAIDNDQDQYDDDLALLHNERANAAWADLRFDESLKEHEEAVRLRPKDHVLRSNLSLSLQENAAIGTRAAYLSRAADELTMAQRLAPEAGYEHRLHQLERDLENVRSFGEFIAEPAARTPIAVEFAANLVAKVNPNELGRDVLDIRLPELRRNLRQRLGFEIPGVRLRPGALQPNSYRILMFDVARASGVAMPDLHCVLRPATELVRLGAEPDELIEVSDPVGGGRCCWLSAARVDSLELSDVDRFSEVDFILRHVEYVVQRNAAEIFGLDVARQWIAEKLCKMDDPAGGSANIGVPGAIAIDEQREFAAARALRVFVRDGVCLDPELLQSILSALGSDEWPPGGWVGPTEQAIQHTRVQLRAKLRQHSDSQLVPIPQQYCASVASGNGLSANEQHQVLQHIGSAVGTGRSFAVVVDRADCRGYFHQLVSGDIGRSAVDITALTTAELRVVGTEGAQRAGAGKGSPLVAFEVVP
jgi:tetratricopeptide (TPR) repeat protein